MASITRPLNLRANITTADTRLDWVACLNVMLVGLLLFFLGSRYIYAPGMLVNVSGAPALPERLDLPALSQSSPGVSPSAVATVLTVQRDNVFLYEGGIHSFNTLERALAAKKGDPAPVLLVKADRDVSMQTFVEVCALAHRAGFAAVQVAVEPREQISGAAVEERRTYLNTLPLGD